MTCQPNVTLADCLLLRRCSHNKQIGTQVCLDSFDLMLFLSSQFSALTVYLSNIINNQRGKISFAFLISVNSNA